MHVETLILSSALLALFVVVNKWRSTRLNISLLQSALRPSQIILGYSLSFFGLGACFFIFENVMPSYFLVDASTWTLWPILLFAASALISIISTNVIRLGPKVDFHNNSIRGLSLPWEWFGILFVFLSVLRDSEILLLVGTSFYIAGAACGRHKSIFFLAVLAAGILLILPTAADGKRYLIFPLGIVLLLILRDGGINRKLFSIVIALTLASILPLSILRGYGQFEPESFFDAIRYVGEYVNSYYFWAALGNNIEAVSFYFHGVNAIQHTMQSGEYVWGETVLNMLFLGSSLYGFDDGLRSAIEIYTLRYDAAFRGIGGSYPVMIFSEIIMNFGIACIFILPLFFIFLDYLWRLINIIGEPTARFSAEAIFFYCIVVFARGSSFDLFLYNSIVLLAPIFVIVLPVSRLILVTRRRLV